jgi:polyphenol oxidase
MPRMIDGTVITAPLLTSLPGIHHGFFTRQGGTSSGIYGSLNCGLGSNDARERVLENRDRVARHLGAGPGSVSTVYQIHSATALIIDRPFAAGAVPKADALVTRTPGVVVAALAADCAPVLFADPTAGVVAAAHAGWRGAMEGIVESTVRAMEQLGATRAGIVAAIGPCIHAASYEVGPEFEARFRAADGGYARFFSVPAAGAKPHFDLPGFVADRLVASGITAYERSARCTYAHPELFYSYRRTTHQADPDYGRQISAIVVA